MGYLKSWHRDHAAESIKGKEMSIWSSDPNYEWALYAVECGQVAALARQVGEEIGSELVSGVAQTVVQTIEDASPGGTPRTRSRRRITDKQRKILAVALLERYGSARGIAAQVWGLADADIDNADV